MSDQAMGRERDYALAALLEIRRACGLPRDSHDDLVEVVTALREELANRIPDFVRGKLKACLVCGAKEPCELKADPAAPCTFDPTPMELHKECQRLREELAAMEREVTSYKNVIAANQREFAKLEEQLEKVKAERQDMIWERDDLLDQVGKLKARIAELEAKP